jgi:hypothetical protein
MSQFDPNAFLNATIEEANSTEMTPVPEGEYLAIADKVTVVPWQKKDGSDSGLKLQIIWDIQDENVKALLERSKITVRQDQMLDLTETGGLALGKGQNVGLGRLRTAVGLNEPGQPFSFAMIQGQVAKVLVKHRMGDQAEQIFAEVRGVTKPQ